MFDCVLGAITLTVQIAGVCCAIRAIMISRTPQAAIGWSLSLAVFPWLAIPLFLVFGESKFSGYVLAGTGRSAELDQALERVCEALRPWRTAVADRFLDAVRVAETLRGLPAVRGNSVSLLIDGQQTFTAIFDAIDSAREWVVVQFYIISDDDLGRELKLRLLAASARGVKCRVLYDQVGSKKMTASYAEQMRDGGVEMHPFVTNRQLGRRFQINFRNHRKLVIVDGRRAFIGGLNAGDEYMGFGPLGSWRDTHLKVEGPAVQAFLVPFLEDWHYVTRHVPALPVSPVEAGEQKVMVFASGPTETWSVTPAIYLELIHDVKKRLWLASPYFVPDPSLRAALAHAALRGVDVRIILPAKADHLLPWLSSFTQYPAMNAAGVKIWRYQPGFMHQKVLLADDELAVVGSVNLDFRSFFLNFELAATVEDRKFAQEVEKMFEADFARSRPEDLAGFQRRSFWFRFACRLAALMSPEQ